MRRPPLPLHGPRPKTCSALRTQQGKTTAEQVYWKERGKTEIEIEALKKAAEQERRPLQVRGERNIPAAAERIVRYVTME